MEEIIYLPLESAAEDVLEVIRGSFDVFRDIGFDKGYLGRLAGIDEGVAGGGFYALLLDGRPVSVLQVVDRTMVVSGAQLRVAGVANIATLPEHRGRGYASRLIRYMLRDLEGKGYALAALYTWLGGAPHRLYRRLGFHDIHVYPEHICVGSDIDALCRGGGGRLAEPIPGALMGIRDQVLGGAGVAYVARSMRRWEAVLGAKQYATWFLGEGRNVYVERGRGAGYAFTYSFARSVLAGRSDHAEGVVLELAARGRRALRETIAAAFSVLRGEGARTIRVSAPAPHTWPLRVCSVRRSSVFMARTAGIDALAAFLKEAANTGTGSITVATPSGYLVIDDRRGEVAVAEKPRGAAVVSEKAFIRIILGASTPRNEYLAGEITLLNTGPGKAVATVTRVLGKHRPHYVSLLDKW